MNQDTVDPFLLQTELHRANLSLLTKTMAGYDSSKNPFVPRVYPGYPEWPLPKVRPRLFGSVEQTLSKRRSPGQVPTGLPSSLQLSRLLWFGHGMQDIDGRGPTPSAGGLASLHLYLVVFPDFLSKKVPWLPAGTYFYERHQHKLRQLQPNAQREDWQSRVPSLSLIQGGRLLWLIVGDLRRVRTKYAFRAPRYLLLEAGHLMQNLCLLSESLNAVTVPLGGVFEHEVGKMLALSRTDVVLYAGLFGIG